MDSAKRSYPLHKERINIKNCAFFIPIGECLSSFSKYFAQPPTLSSFAQIAAKRETLFVSHDHRRLHEVTHGGQRHMCFSV